MGKARKIADDLIEFDTSLPPDCFYTPWKPWFREF
jgi:hypothetical protein